MAEVVKASVPRDAGPDLEPRLHAPLALDLVLLVGPARVVALPPLAPVRATEHPALSAGVLWRQALRVDTALASKGTMRIFPFFGDGRE